MKAMNERCVHYPGMREGADRRRRHPFPATSPKTSGHCAAGAKLPAHGGIVSTPGWYRYPGGQTRYWDGYGWIAAQQPTPGLSPKQKWWLIGGSVAAAIIFSVLAGVHTYLDSRPVRNAHSDDPGIEAFYREIEADGFGNMKVSDANSRGKQACDGDGLVLWGTADYSMADSFNFAAAAMQGCPALRRTG